MGAMPASAVQQAAYNEILDKYLPADIRHRFACYADDIAVGADTLPELLTLFKALAVAQHKGGIQVKAQKVKFGHTSVKSHNYNISKDQTTVKPENLCPIRQMKPSTNVTEVKAFLGCTGHMAHHCQMYAIVAAPLLHNLTRKVTVFPKHWIPGSDYDIAFWRLKSMIIDQPLVLWNKLSSQKLFVEVDASQQG